MLRWFSKILTKSKIAKARIYMKGTVRKDGLFKVNKLRMLPPMPIQQMITYKRYNIGVARRWASYSKIFESNTSFYPPSTPTCMVLKVALSCNSWDETDVELAVEQNLSKLLIATCAPLWRSAWSNKLFRRLHRRFRRTSSFIRVTWLRQQSWPRTTNRILFAFDRKIGIPRKKEMRLSRNFLSPRFYVYGIAPEG